MGSGEYGSSLRRRWLIDPAAGVEHHPIDVVGAGRADPDGRLVGIVSRANLLDGLAAR